MNANPTHRNEFSSAGDKLATSAENTKSKVGEMADDAKKMAKDAIDSGSERLASTAESVKSTVSNMAGDASRMFKDTIEEQKTAGAGAIASLAKSARESAEGFESDAPQIAGAVKAVATKVEQVSNDLKDTTINDMFDSVASFAQKKPLAAVGCGVLAGLVLARLLTTPASRS